MKRIFLFIALGLFLCPPMVFAQNAKIQVFYKLLKPNAVAHYSLAEGTFLGVKSGAEGDVYAPYDDVTNTKSTKVGTYKITVSKDYSAEVEVSFDGDVSSAAALYAEFFIEPYNPNYVGLVSLIVARGIVFTDIYEEEILNFQNREEAALSEYLSIMDLVASAQKVAEVLSESMDDYNITEGAYANRGMFEVLENTTYIDVYSFLSYVNEHWKLYFGNTWSFAEVYATWLTSDVAVIKASGVVGNAGLGFSLLRDFKYSNFPVIAEMQPAYWGGFNEEMVQVKTLITRINGESMFNKTLDEVYAAIGTDENEIVNIEFFNHGVFESYNLPLLKINAYKPSVVIEDLEMKTPNVYPVIKDEKWGLIDGNGDYILSPKYDKIEGIFFEFNNGLAEVEINKKIGFINILGKEIIAPQYKACRSFSEGLAAIIEKEDESAFSREFLMGFIDVEGNRISTMKYDIPSLYIGEYHGGMCVISEYVDGTFKKGYLDLSGKLVIPMKYYSASWFSEGYGIVQETKDSKYGIIDKKGNYVLEPSFDFINGFYEGEALAHINKHYWLIDPKGKKLVDFKNNRPSTMGGYTHDLFRIYTPDKKVGMMNRDGKMIIQPKFKSISGVSRELMSASFEEGNMFFIDKKGETVIDGPFQEVGYFSEGVCWVKQNDLWGLIDENGDWVIEPVSSKRPSAFHGPLAKIDIGDFINPHYLYVNKNGTIVYNPEN